MLPEIEYVQLNLKPPRCRLGPGRYMPNVVVTLAELHIPGESRVPKQSYQVMEAGHVWLQIAQGMLQKVTNPVLIQYLHEIAAAAGLMLIPI